MSNTYQSLKDHVCSYIADLIANDQVPDSGKIVEQEICDALGVSRTPVREALIQLAADGFLESVPRRGFFINRLTREKAIEIVQILGPLDGRAAYLASGRMNIEEIAELRRIHESIASAMRAGDYLHHNELQHEFHNYYLERCGNKRLIEIVQHLNWYFMKRETINVVERGLVSKLEQSVVEHEEIVRLFEAGDAEALQRYIRDVHWDMENVDTLTW